MLKVGGLFGTYNLSAIYASYKPPWLIHMLSRGQYTKITKDCITHEKS